MNRKELMALLRKSFAYSGKAELSDVEAFVNDPENGISLVDKGGKALDLKAIWAKTVTVTADAGEEIRVEKADNSGDVESGPDVQTSQPSGGEVDGASRSKSFGATASFNAPKIHASKTKARLYNERARRGETAFTDAEAASEFGNFVKKSWENKLSGKAQSLGNNSEGGYTVPTDVLADLIANRANVGLARKLVRKFDIPRDKANVPMRSSGLTVYAPGENTAITASSAAFGQCAFDAVQMGTLTQASVELLHDSVLDIGAIIGDEINFAFANKEDEIAFAPVGTATTFSQVSIPRAIYNQVVTTAGGTWTTDAHKLYHPGVTNAAGNAWSEITLANLYAVPGKLPDYAHDGACWIVSQAFWGQVMLPLAMTAAGTTATEVVNGIRVPTFLGYPVYRTSQMPTSEGNSQICALFGNPSRTAALADVRGSMSIDFDTSLYFNTASVAIRGLQRVAFTPFDVGTANSSAASRIDSPMCALATLNA